MPMTTTQVAEETGVPKRTVIAAINRGDLPATKLPGLTGAFLIDREDVDAWIQGRGQ